MSGYSHIGPSHVNANMAFASLADPHFWYVACATVQSNSNALPRRPLSPSFLTRRYQKTETIVLVCTQAGPKERGSESFTSRFCSLWTLQTRKPIIQLTGGKFYFPVVTDRKRQSRWISAGLNQTHPAQAGEKAWKADSIVFHQLQLNLGSPWALSHKADPAVFKQSHSHSEAQQNIRARMM